MHLEHGRGVQTQQATHEGPIFNLALLIIPFNASSYWVNRTALRPRYCCPSSCRAQCRAMAPDELKKCVSYIRLIYFSASLVAGRVCLACACTLPLALFHAPRQRHMLHWGARGRGDHPRARGTVQCRACNRNQVRRARSRSLTPSLPPVYGEQCCGNGCASS